MKQVYPNYTFVASTKTITLVGSEFHQGQILLITNATRGAIYYNFASSSLRAAVTTGGGNTTIVLTDASTSGHQNSDKLIIHYDDLQEKSAVSSVDGLQDGNGSTFGLDRDFPVSGTVDISAGSIADLDISEQVRSGVFNWADSELSGNVQAGIGVRNASEFEAGISLIRAVNFPANFTNFNGFYRLDYARRADNADGLYVVYRHCNAVDFQEFTPLLKLERSSGQWAWFFTAEENVCVKYISAPTNGTYVSPANLNNFDPGGLGGLFTSVYVVRADAIPTTNPAIGNTHDFPAVDAQVDTGASGSSLISLGKGIFQKLKLVPSIGTNTDTSAASDTGNHSLFSFFKRLLSVKLPNAVSGRVPVDGSGVTQPISAAALPLPSGASTSSNQTTTNTRLGATDEAAASSDTANSGLNGLLKRLLQGITSLIPANLTVNSTRLLVDATGTVTANTNTEYYDAANDERFQKSLLCKDADDGSGEVVLITNSNPLPVSGTVTATLADQQYDSGTPVFVPAYFDSPGGSVIPVSQDANAGMPISGSVTANVFGYDPANDEQKQVQVTEDGFLRVALSGSEITQPISATSLPLPEGTVNQSAWFAYSGAGTHAAFDCGADADYVYIYLNGGGGGYAHNLQLSPNSAFTSFSDTTSGGLNLYQERMPTQNLDPTALNFSNARFQSGSTGVYVLSLHQAGSGPNIKNRWIRVSVTGGGGGGWSIRYVSVRAPYKGQPSNFTNFPGHRTLTHSIVDINSTLRELPVAVLGTAQTSDRGATGMATVSTFSSVNSGQLRPLNPARKLLTIYNEGAGNLHVLYGSGTASTTNYSVKLFTGDYLEIDKYTGQVNAIFASAGTARVTEIT